MKKTLLAVSKSALALSLLGALPAAAGTATYAGALCVPVTNSGTPTYFRSGRLINQTANEIEVVCPIQRNVVVPGYAEDMSVIASVFDPGLATDVCCTATVAERDGTPITASQVCTPAGTADLNNHRSIFINLPSVFAALEGYVSLRCDLPGQVSVGGTTYSSVLASFMVSE
jgi:hypothetical protein